jgi:hypothetical protein
LPELYRSTSTALNGPTTRITLGPIDRTWIRSRILLLAMSLLAACNNKGDGTASDDSGACPYEGSFQTVREFGAEVVPVFCAHEVRCQTIGSTTYDECVSFYLNERYTSNKCEWDDSWSCDAAQCIKEWSAQEEYYQVSEPECENEPSPWRPEVCNELYLSMRCDWNEGM